MNSIRIWQSACKFSTSSLARSSFEVRNLGNNVVHVEMNRPDRRNAFTLDMWRESKKIFDELSLDPECRAIVLSGKGKSFCSGIDLQMGMSELIKAVQDDSIDVGRKARMIERIVTDAQAGFTAIEKCSKPVIAAVHSHCVGAGVDMITACDIRYASQDSTFCVKEVDIGMAADVGTLNRFPKIGANESWVKEVCLTARNFGADEALQYGLISRIFVSPKECVNGALDLAASIAEKSPIAVQGTKKTLNYARDHTVDESLEMIKMWNMSQLLSTDLFEGAMAAMQKKKPSFKNL
ncbi:unnamed protein product [Auanema sp. JU1783]|nr:unnamed protein product [Auanema sp. JU1783]